MALSPARALMNVQSQRRIKRSPKHTFQTRQKPYAITPFMIAPVLPHETLDNLLYQRRVVSDPIKNALVGWWYDTAFFYVKHRDLAIRDDLVEMVLDANKDMSALYAANNEKTYHHGGSTSVAGSNAIDYVDLCLDSVTEHFFRDEGEAVGIVEIDGYPAAKIDNAGMFDSLLLDSQMPSTPTIGGSNPQDTEAAMNTWEFMRMQGLTEMDYEDFLKSYGVRGEKAEDPAKPELLRYVRSWTYPTNTVNPSSGVPTSACSWSIAERADKKRYFPEPGFIFGVSVARPKVYLSGQKGAGVGALVDAFGWLPAIMRANPETALKEYASGKGPYGGIAAGYWVDRRDLFIHGDQFVNFAVSGTDKNFVALPLTSGQKKYPTEADVDGLFYADTAEYVRSDGIVSLSIRGQEVDES